MRCIRLAPATWEKLEQLAAARETTRTGIVEELVKRARLPKTTQER